MPRYQGPIIDAHHHLWDWGMGRHDWLNAGGESDSGLPMGSLAPLRRDYLVEDYLRDTASEGIVASVHVEAKWDGPPEEETAWLDGLDRSRVAARHIFYVDLAAENAPERVAKVAAHPRAVGLRDIVSWHPDPNRAFAARDGLMSDPAWRRGLKAVEEAGLVFDLMLYPMQMAEADALIADFPGLTFVLEHCGSPADRSPEGMALWRDGLARLARHQNLYLKISNPVAYDHDWTPESLAVVIRHCYACFGPVRAMFGSDLPVSGLHADFSALLAVYRDILAEEPEEDQAAFFHDTAARVYRLRAEATA